MKTLLAGLLLAGSATLALAAGTYRLDHVTITGSQSVPASQLYPVLQERPGTSVTTNEILADQDALSAALQKQHVVGAIKTSLVDKHNGHVDVIFAVQDQGVQAPVVTSVAPKLGQEIFAGNKLIDSATLTSAAGLVPGQALSEKALQDAEARIGDIYKKKNIGVSIAPKIAQPPGGVVTVTWNITESKQKKKKKNTEDEGGYQTDQ